MKKLFTALILFNWLLSACGPPNARREIAAGEEALNRGDITRAVMLLEEAARNKPGDGRACNLYALALYSFGKPVEAMAAFERALAISPDDPVLHCNLALTAFKARDYPVAIEHFERCLRLDPKNLSAWLFLGATYLSLNDLDAATRATLTARALSPQNPDALNNLAVIACRRGRGRDAEAWLKKAMETPPDYPPLHLNLARLCELDLQDKPRALEHYRRFSALEPQSPLRFSVLRSTRQLELDLHLPPGTFIPTNVTAAAVASAPKPETATTTTPTNHPPAAMRELLTNTPPDLQPAALRLQIEQLIAQKRNRDAAEAALMLADLYRQQNDMARASDTITRAVEIDPLNHAAHFRLAELLADQGQKTAALQSFQEAVRLQPDSLAALQRSAALAVELSQPAVAASAYKRITEISPDEPGAYLKLAEIQERQLKNRAAAEQTYQRFLKKFPNSSDAAVIRARIVPVREATPLGRISPKPAPAKPAAPKPVTTAPAPRPAPPDLGAQYKAALALLTQGDFVKAAPQFETILQHNPNHAMAHLALGQIYSANRQTRPAAREHYRRFLELRPDDPKAEEVRRWLATAR